MVAKAKRSAPKKKQPPARKSVSKKRAKSRSHQSDMTEIDPARVMGWVGTGPPNGRGPHISDTMPIGAWNASAAGSPTHFAHVLVQTQMEMAALVGRRSRACLDYPEHMAKCLTPQQVLEHQARFIHEMVQDYNATNDRIMRTWLEGPTYSRS